MALACAKAVVEGLDDLMMPEYRRQVTEWLTKLKADKEVNPSVHNLMAEWLPDLMKPIPADAPPAKVRRVDALTLSASTGTPTSETSPRSSKWRRPRVNS